MMQSQLLRLHLISLVVGITLAQVNLCPDKKTVCQKQETCVTWERGCSIAANCLGPGLFEGFTECVNLSKVKPPLLPSKALCTADEIFARSVDKLCRKPPCPLRLGYNCYPDTGTKPSCTGFKCGFGRHCVIDDEDCSDVLCEPKPNCKPNV